MKVIPNSGADRAALHRTGRDTEGNIHLGDVIIEVDGKTVGSSDDLYMALQDHKVGDTVALTVIRDDKQQRIQVTLDEGNGGDL